MRTSAQTPPMSRRRDRRGHGIRGGLLPTDIPGWRSRATTFDESVLAAVTSLEPRWATELADIEFAVEDVPPSDPAPWELGEIPLGRCFPNDGELPARIVVYRRPVESRAAAHSLQPLIHHVVVEQFAHILGLPPRDVDPSHDG